MEPVVDYEYIMIPERGVGDGQTEEHLPVFDHGVRTTKDYW